MAAMWAGRSLMGSRLAVMLANQSQKDSQKAEDWACLKSLGFRLGDLTAARISVTVTLLVHPMAVLMAALICLGHDSVSTLANQMPTDSQMVGDWAG